MLFRSGLAEDVHEHQIGTVIGHHSVVGSNAFVTKSVAPYTKISIENQELQLDIEEQ